MSEVIPQDEDRGGCGAIEGRMREPALPDAAAAPEEETAGGEGSDDGGPGSLNM